MPWGRLDDGLYDHPKLDALGDDRLPAVGLWVLAISWCNRYLTDGRLTHGRVLALGGSEALAKRLVMAGLFDIEEGGYRVHDFFSFNESKVDVEARRASERDRQRRYRDSLRDSGGTNTVTNGVTHPPSTMSRRDTHPNMTRDYEDPARASRPLPSVPFPSRPSPAPAPARPVRNSVAGDPLLREIKAAVEKRDAEAAGVEDL